MLEGSGWSSLELLQAVPRDFPETEAASRAKFIPNQTQLPVGLFAEVTGREGRLLLLSLGLEPGVSRVESQAPSMPLTKPSLSEGTSASLTPLQVWDTSSVQQLELQLHSLFVCVQALGLSTKSRQGGLVPLLVPAPVLPKPPWTFGFYLLPCPAAGDHVFHVHGSTV